METKNKAESTVTVNLGKKRGIVTMSATDFDAHMNTLRGSIRLNKKGEFEVESYIVNDGLADVYRNRRWFQAAVVPAGENGLVDLARSHFGTGRLVEMTDSRDRDYNARRWHVYR